MATNESRRRLLKNGKPVGYELALPKGGIKEDYPDLYYTLDDHEDCDIVTFAVDMEMQLMFSHVRWDFFEHGIKQPNGKWVFEGDIFELKNRSEKVYVLHYKSQSLEEISAFDFVYWQLKGKTDEVDLYWGLFECSGKHIGNIHQEAADAAD